MTDFNSVYCKLQSTLRLIAVKPRLHDTTCCQTGLYNRFDNRLYRVNGALALRSRVTRRTRHQCVSLGYTSSELPRYLTFTLFCMATIITITTRHGASTSTRWHFAFSAIRICSGYKLA